MACPRSHQRATRQRRRLPNTRQGNCRAHTGARAVERTHCAHHQHHNPRRTMTMADIGYTAITTISTIKKGASVASATFKRYSDGSFEFTAGTNTKRYTAGGEANEFLKFMLTQINALV